MRVEVGPCGGQRQPVPLELELKMVVSYLMWVLGS